MSKIFLRTATRSLLNFPHIVLIILTVLCTLIAVEIFAGYRALDYNIVQGDAYYFQQLIHNFAEKFVYEVSYVWSRAEQQPNVTWIGEHKALIDRAIVTGVWFYWLPYKLFPLPLTNYYTTLILVMFVSVWAIKRLNTTFGGDRKSFIAFAFAFMAAPLLNGLSIPLLRQKNYIEALNVPCLLVILTFLLSKLYSISPATNDKNSSTDTIKLRSFSLRDFALLVISYLIFLGYKEDSIFVAVTLWGVLAVLTRRPKFLGFSAFGLACYFFYKKVYFPYLWHTYIAAPTEFIDGLTSFVVHRIHNLTLAHVINTMVLFSVYTFPGVPLVLITGYAALKTLKVKILQSPAGQLGIACCICTGIPFFGMLIRDYGPRNYCMAVSLLITAGMSFFFIWNQSDVAKISNSVYVNFIRGLIICTIPVIGLAMVKSSARSVRYFLNPNPIFTQFKEIEPIVTKDKSVAVCDGNARYSFLFAMRYQNYPCAAITAKRPDYIVVFKTLTDPEDIAIQTSDLAQQSNAMSDYRMIQSFPDIDLLQRVN